MLLKWWFSLTDFQGSRDIHRKKKNVSFNRFPPGNPSPSVGRTVVDPPRGIVGEISVAQQFPPEGHRENEKRHTTQQSPTWSAMVSGQME